MTEDLGEPPQSDRLFWDKWHMRRLDRRPRSEPSMMARSFRGELGSPPAAILELGYGDAVDSAFFADKGFFVTAVEIAPTAAVRARLDDRFRRCEKRITLLEQDIADLANFEDESFDGIFSELALHYFNADETVRVFSELQRICRIDGLLGFSVKSTSDPLYGLGTKLDQDMYYYNGHRRHFFSAAYTQELLSSWKVLKIEDHVGTYDSDGKANAFVRALARRV